MALLFDEVILELYRLAETKTWDGDKSTEAMAVAIEAMEHIWTLKQADTRKNAAGSPGRKQARIWS